MISDRSQLSKSMAMDHQKSSRALIHEPSASVMDNPHIVKNFDIEQISGKFGAL